MIPTSGAMLHYQDSRSLRKDTSDARPSRPPGKGFHDIHDIDLEDNPFVLPPDDVFLLRSREKIKKRSEQRRQNQMKIWEKNKPTPEYLRRTKISSTSSSSSAVRATRGGAGGGGGASREGGLLTAGGDSHSHNRLTVSRRRREKENMTEFIAKKREMFLIQISLDTKKQEIQKLEDKVKESMNA